MNIYEFLWTNIKARPLILDPANAESSEALKRTVHVAADIANRLASVYEALKDFGKSLNTFIELFHYHRPVQHLFPYGASVPCLQISALCERYGMGKDRFVFELLCQAQAIMLAHGIGKSPCNDLMYCVILERKANWIEGSQGPLQSVSYYRHACETARSYKINVGTDLVRNIVDKLAYLYHCAGAFSLSEEQYGYLCTEVAPDIPVYHYHRGVNLIHKGDVPLATQVMRHAISLMRGDMQVPFKSMAEFFLGQLLFDAAREDESIEWFNCALSDGLSGAHGLYALSNLAYIYAKKSRFIEANQKLAEAVKLCATNIEASPLTQITRRNARRLIHSQYPLPFHGLHSIRCQNAVCPPRQNCDSARL
jgi:tetratricopeptide (TPR) repeat protein